MKQELHPLLTVQQDMRIPEKKPQLPLAKRNGEGSDQSKRNADRERQNLFREREERDYVLVFFIFIFI